MTAATSAFADLRDDPPSRGASTSSESKKAVAAVATRGKVAGYDFSGGWPGQPKNIAIGVGELALAGATLEAQT